MGGAPKPYMILEGMRVEHGPTVTARGDDTGSLNPLSLARHGPSGLPSMRRPLGPGSRIPPPCRAAGPTTASRRGPAGSAGSPCRATALATVRTPACSPRTGRRHTQAQRDRVRQGRCAQCACPLLPATTARAIKDSVRTAHRAWRVRRLAERSVFEALGPAGSTPGIASPAARSTTPTSGRPAQARRKAGRCRQCGQRTAGRVCATHRLLHNALQTARRAAS